MPIKCLEYPFESAYILKRQKAIRRELLASGTEFINKRIAVLGGASTREIINILELFLLNHGIRPSFYESEYGRYWQEAMFPSDELNAFSPELIYIHTGFRNLVPLPSVKNTFQEAEAMLAEQYDRFMQMWVALSKQFNCPIIQNNFERPAYRLLGNMDITDPRGHSSFASRMNQRFYEYAASNKDFFIHDIEYLSSVYGLESWSEPSAWYMYKYILSIRAIPELSHNLANIIKSLFGKNKKALVLDLDNTLWGGVVGEEGAERIEIGPELPVGQVYLEFQQYIKAHMDLGVLLTISSKNEIKNAISGLEHKECVLRPEDFTLIKADWGNKDSHAADIADELNLGLDSLVFVDDNPAERKLVSGLPGICVPALDGVESFRTILDRGGYFEVTRMTDDDKRRAQMYFLDRKREHDRSAFADYGAYLLSLNMKASIGSFKDADMLRVAQLVNKTNQFNLTAKRLSESELRQMASSQRYICLRGRLQDKYGDNGIVSVITGELDGEALTIILWLMSCRVFKRDMEYAMFDELVANARSNDVKTIRGIFVPTAKNVLVRNLYDDLGFCKRSEDGNGIISWTLDADKYKARNHVIAIERD